MRVEASPAGFGDWEALRALVAAAFADMEGRIDPPSSLAAMGPADFAALAAAGPWWLAREGAAPVGCLFGARREGALHLSKLAVRPDRQGRGLGRALVEAAAASARAEGLAALTLGTRVELVENHAAFARMGFVETGRSAHAGFDRPTSVEMRRELRTG